MKVPWSAIWSVAKAVYVAFLKGKTVKLPGIGPVTLPQQRNTIQPLASFAPKQDDSAPLSVATLGLVLFVVFGLPIIGLTILGVLEWRTLADDKPGNHITATLRAAWKRQPGAVFLATLVWFAFISAVTWGVLGHVFWS